ncbi:MAG: glutamine-hydrolyzing GMP synthase [Candidatus Bathyarchaeota archaeon]
MIKPDTILILDFGGQYCHLIARRIRDQKVFSEVVPPNIHPNKISALKEKFNVKGIILSGGPSSVHKKNTPNFAPQILDMNIPVLGLCYGHQLISHISGGKVKTGSNREYGITHVMIDKPIGVLNGLNKKEKVWMSHGDTVLEPPPKYQILAHTENCPVAALRHNKKPIYGLQWHPEVVHTKKGDLMLKNFIFEVCRCKQNWVMDDFIQKSTDEIKQKIQDDKCIVALSGGIDSSTVAILATRAVGKNLTAVFVDHGFMRKGEPDFVKDVFIKLGVNLISVDAKERFLKKIQGVRDPESKRKIIGEEFIRVFEEVAKKIKAKYLLQGTIYPDRIESGFSKDSEKIKTHHNVGGIPANVEFKEIVEPLMNLYKDEVRKVAEKLGLPREIVWRQPFPGPGLAVRIVGKVTQQKITALSKADKIVEEEIEKSGLNKSLWQYFAVLTDTKSTGVKGDSRAYGYTIAVRTVESMEAMTASYARVPYEILEKVSTRITNEIPQVTRVVYDITHKPPSTIEWE